MEPIERKIMESIAKITNIPAEIYFRHGTNSICVMFEKAIPSEEDCRKIETVLADFGKPISNSYRESGFVSWIILR